MTEQKKVEREGAGAAETSHIAADPAPVRHRRLTAADVSGWRVVLSGAGGRSDERRHLDLHGQDLRRFAGVQGLGTEPGQRVLGFATGTG